MQQNCLAALTKKRLPSEVKSFEQPARKNKVLLVDDSLIMISKLKELVEEVTNISEIRSCTNYHTAVGLLSSYQPNVVLLDINLPDKNGIELLNYIRTTFSHVIVIMVTNQSGDKYRNLCLQFGAFDFVNKADDFERIPYIISSLG